jgi:hypothetical protein
MKDKSGGRVEGWLADPPGSVLFNLVENGKKERVGTGSITEGEFKTSWLASRHQRAGSEVHTDIL